MQKRVLVFLVVVFIVMGIVSGFLAERGAQEPPWWMFSTTILVSATIFYWYHTDSTSKAYKRSIWMNAGVIGFAPLGLLVYVFRSNARDVRLRAVGKLMGYFVLLAVASAAGEALGMLIG